MDQGLRALYFYIETRTRRGVTVSFRFSRTSQRPATKPRNCPYSRKAPATNRENADGSDYDRIVVFPACIVNVGSVLLHPASSSSSSSSSSPAVVDVRRVELSFLVAPINVQVPYYFVLDCWMDDRNLCIWLEALSARAVLDYSSCWLPNFRTSCKRSMSRLSVFVSSISLFVGALGKLNSSPHPYHPTIHKPPLKALWATAHPTPTSRTSREVTAASAIKVMILNTA